jgi:Ca-activated chloride channel family protein
MAMLFAAGVLAQEVSPESHFKDAVSVGYVMVPFTALGAHNVPVTDLRADEVALYVDGLRVASDIFERSANAPVSFTILLDSSGSMGLAGKMESARAAVRTLLDQRRPGDDFALYVFAADTAIEAVPFTSDAGAILRAMEKTRPFGKTAFFDALATMPDTARLGRNATRAIILLSDGIDNASHMTREALATKLEGVSVPIYALGLREPAEKRPPGKAVRNEALSDLELLDEMTRLTGGRLFVGNRPEQLIAAANRLQQNMRAQYLIGFTPTGKGAVKYRRISLKLAGRIRSVRVRSGYHGTEPPVLTTSRAGGKHTR